MEGPDYTKQKAIMLSILGNLGWDKTDQAEERIQKCGKDLVAWLAERGEDDDNHFMPCDTKLAISDRWR